MPTRRNVACCAVATVLLLTACNIDTVVPPSPQRALPNGIAGSADISVEESITDPGPFPITPAVSYSRCPDTQTLQQAKWLSLSNPKVVSISNPDGASLPNVVFEIPLRDLKFYTYINQGTITSQANYRLAREILSNDQKWAIPYEGSVTMQCVGGHYVDSPFNGIAEYVGALKIIAVWDVRPTNLADDADPPAPPACDDPLTEIVEEYPDCAPPPPAGAWGAGDARDAPVQVQVSGGGSTQLRYMCDVIDWYEWNNGQWEYIETQILWNTCSWE